jgi:hypothetical protein
MFRKKVIGGVVGLAGALGVWGFCNEYASAVVLAPGGSSTSMTGTYSTYIAADGAPVDTQTRTYSGMVHGLAFDFSLVTNVYDDPNTHGDDFTYQLTNTAPMGDGSDSFARMTMSSFLGYSVDADYEANTGLIQTGDPGDVAPNEVDRNSYGSVVGYDFASMINPTGESDILVILTNGTTYTMGSATVIDNTNGSVVTSVPYGTTVVPEPTSLAMIAVSLGMLARRRRCGS